MHGAAAAEEVGGSRDGDGWEVAGLLGAMRGDAWTWMSVSVKTRAVVGQGTSRLACLRVPRKGLWYRKHKQPGKRQW